MDLLGANVLTNLAPHAADSKPAHKEGVAVGLKLQRPVPALAGDEKPIKAARGWSVTSVRC